MKKLYLVLFVFLIMKNQNILAFGSVKAPVAREAHKDTVKTSSASRLNTEPKVTMMEKALTAVKSEAVKFKEFSMEMTAKLKESINSAISNKATSQTAQPSSLSQGLFISKGPVNSSQQSKSSQGLLISENSSQHSKNSGTIDLSSFSKPVEIQKSVNNNKSDFVQSKIDQIGKAEIGSKTFESQTGDGVIFTTVNAKGKTIHSVMEFKDGKAVESFIDPITGNKEFIRYENNKEVGRVLSDKAGNVIKNGQETGEIIGGVSKKPLSDNNSSKSPEIKEKITTNTKSEQTTGTRADGTTYNISKLVEKNAKGKDVTTLDIRQKNEKGELIKNAEGKNLVLTLDLSSLATKLKDAKTTQDVYDVITKTASEFISNRDVMKLLEQDRVFIEFQSEIAAQALKPTSLDKAMFTMRTLADFFTQVDYGKIIKNIGKSTRRVVLNAPVGFGVKVGTPRHYTEAEVKTKVAELKTIRDSVQSQLEKSEAYYKDSAKSKLDQQNYEYLVEQLKLAEKNYNTALKISESDFHIYTYTVRDAVADMSSFISKNKEKLLSKLKTPEKQKSHEDFAEKA